MKDDAISIRFHHGLGDCALFAPALKMWIDRGYTINVEVTPDKAPMFEAVGCTVQPGGRDHHYWHPPNPGDPAIHDHWSGNKLAFNLCERPLPNIGSWEELWPEYLTIQPTLVNHLSKKSRKEIDGFMKSLEGPLVLVHTQGNTSAGAKNLHGYQETETYRSILDKTDATILSLDWDNRVSRFPSRRVRHLLDDFRGLSLPELWYLLQGAECLVGVDSGPLHLAEKWTNTPVVGIWLGHHPAHFSIPRKSSVHLVTGIGSGRSTWNKHRRHSFNLIDVGNEHSGSVIGEQVRRVLDGKVGRKLILEDLLDRVHVANDWYQDRDRTFRLCLDHLNKKPKPQMVETGCIRSEDDWTAGFSTYIFGLALDGFGKLDSVDITPSNCEFARKWTSGFDSVTVHESDSLAWLESWTGPKIDVAYLDSLDVDQPGHAEHGLREAQLVLPHLAEDGLVLIDDTFWQKAGWVGKGKLAIPFLQDQGFRIVYSGYQTLLQKGA